MRLYSQSLQSKFLVVALSIFAIGNSPGICAESSIEPPASPPDDTAPLGSLAEVREPTANTQQIPKRILKTGINLGVRGLSPNTLQLAKSIGLIPVLQRIQSLRSTLSQTTGAPTLESLSARQDLWDATQKAMLIIQKTDLEVDYAISEMNAEYQVYCEMLSKFTNDRDKLVARTNAISFISNGILWALNGAFGIPTYRYPRLSIPSGIFSIEAGIIPSIASLYTLRELNGAKKTSDVDPNMLAKIFDYPTNADVEYPQSVWTYINQVPANEPGAKTRRVQLVDRWIADANIPAFTDRTSKMELDILTASSAERKGLTISSLTTRSVMLQQLSAEVMKMKRMLMELSMVLSGDKQISL